LPEVSQNLSHPGTVRSSGFCISNSQTWYCDAAQPTLLSNIVLCNFCLFLGVKNWQKDCHFKNVVEVFMDRNQNVKQVIH
jgi:hypothetical protein